MADPRRPGEEEAIARFLAERGATVLPQVNPQDRAIDEMLAGRITDGRKRRAVATNRFWDRRKKAGGDVQRAT